MAKNYQLIYNKGNNLFSNEQINDRKSLEQTDFEARFKDVAGDVCNSVEVAIDKFKQTAKDHPVAASQLNYKPNGLNCFIKAEIISNPNLEWGEHKGRRPYLLVDGNKLLIKKFNKYLMPSNIPTKNVKMIDSQKSDDGNDTVPILFLGYTVDSNYSDITGLYVSYIKDGRTLWRTDVYSLAWAELANRHEISTSTDTEEVDIIIKESASIKKAQ